MNVNRSRRASFNQSATSVRAERKSKGETLVSKRQRVPQSPLHPYNPRQFQLRPYRFGVLRGFPGRLNGAGAKFLYFAPAP
jgi:hypothetical protein